MADMTNTLSAIEIRPYTDADWSRLCEIHDAARLDELGLSVGIEAFLSLEDTHLSEGLFDDRLSVAVIDDVVCGFVAFNQEELTWLYVEPSFYRRGVGKALVRHAVSSAPSEMKIELLDGNDPALKLYESQGFVVSKKVQGHLLGNEQFAATGLVLIRKPDGGSAG